MNPYETLADLFIRALSVESMHNLSVLDPDPNWIPLFSNFVDPELSPSI